MKFLHVLGLAIDLLPGIGLAIIGIALIAAGVVPGALLR